MTADATTQPTQAAAARRAPLGLLLRLALTSALIVAIAGYVPLGEVRAQLGQAAPQTLALAAALALARTALAGLRLRLLLAPKGIDTSVWTLTGDHLISVACSFFLPTSAGGDVARLVYMRQRGAESELVIGALLSERIIGVISVVALAALGVVLVGLSLGGGLTAQLLLASAVILGAALVCFHPATARLLLWLLPTRRLPWLTRVVAVAERLSAFQRPRGAFAAALLASLAYQLSGLFLLFLIGREVGVELGFSHYLVILPVAYVTTAIPISVNGLGLREGTVIALCAHYGQAPSASAALAVATLAMILVQAIAGGALLLLRRGPTPSASGP